ncbi:MAG TPA: amidohydrolase family protein [Acetobacteraceae bacterium]|jgi:aminocarboxymuconate-semialdehyde decarboxylase|nr:amidohydrolase family protein [Acetobacteraceae bacterium]
MYWAPPDTGVAIAQATNDGMAERAGAYPDHFLPLATLPMQAPDRATCERERAIGLGLRGTGLCTHVNGTDLDDPRFVSVLTCAERLDVRVFRHPQNAGDLIRLRDYHLWNLIGRSMETATAAARLILSGVFVRHPNLKIVLAHGGGFLPYQLGRRDHGYRVGPALCEHLPHPPSCYLANITCDARVHDTTALRFLLDCVGADHVVLGSDDPFDMGQADPADPIRAPGLPRAQKAAILGGTLERLSRLTPR